MTKPIVLQLDEPGARARLVQHLAEALADEGDPRGEFALLVIAERLVDGLATYAGLVEAARNAAQLLKDGKLVVFKGPRLFKDDGTLNTIDD